MTISTNKISDSVVLVTAGTTASGHCARMWQLGAEFYQIEIVGEGIAPSMLRDFRKHQRTCGAAAGTLTISFHASRGVALRKFKKFVTAYYHD